MALSLAQLAFAASVIGPAAIAAEAARTLAQRDKTERVKVESSDVSA